MEQPTPETIEQAAQILGSLNAQVARITEELRSLVALGDWDAIKNVLRVLAAHAQARSLRAQGQPAQAHLWLVGLGRKRSERRRVKHFLPAESA